MPTACLNQPRCRVRLESERLIVSGPDPNDPEKTADLRELPLRDLDRVIAVESTQFTSESIGALLRRDIPLTLLDHHGSFLGAFLPAINDHGRSRLRQYQRHLDAPFALAAAGRIVAAKIYNQRRVIQRMAANRGIDCSAGLLRLEQMLHMASRCSSIDELRGCEGAASARCFELWATFLPPAFPFERRSRRPPHNPVNACLSFGATLLYNETAAFLHAHGLDPAPGLLHATENGRWSLALDLMEPFRPVLTEALALDLFTHQILNARHFEPQNGGIYLNQDGRAKFLLQYEKRMERQFMSESAGHRTTLRQQLENQATLFKSALDSPDNFEPFLMN
ncbi:MAG: CRISPR-associated endonuclease Cas1 [Verrucomicrobiales bacterium]|nr:CRISPR-associated endonuclease Cas1 [Verrucomicrobiales bacterium]